MIDIEKEREAYEEHCKSIGLGQALEKKGGEFADSTMQTAWNGWLSCAESKQAEIDDLKAQLEAIKSEKCVWRENEFLGTFHAGCDNLFELMNTDSLAQNKIYYCPFCGKKIDEDFGESEDE